MDPAWKKAVVENNKSFISCSPSDGKTNERDLTGPSLCGPLLWRTGNQGTPVWSWHTAMAEVLHWSPWPRSHISHYPRYISGPRRHSSAETQRCGRQRAGAVNPVTQAAAAPGPAPAPPHPPCYCHRHVGWENMELIPLLQVSPVPSSSVCRACPRTRSSYSDHRPAIRCFQTIPPVLKANLRQFSAIMYYSDYNLEILQRYKVELLWQ